MRIYDIIQKKRDKKALTENEIRFFINGCTDNTIPDYQISALLMAIFLNGMSDHETIALTMEMAKSGDMLNLSSLDTVDKHSTGGVGDKTTLIVAPIIAACGGTIAKMSGRGLGHTGGTIDKLESISGFKTSLSPTLFERQIKEIGIAIIGQSGDLAPADKKIYALRDVTATVDSIPLIASSIMSKKLAAGAKSIVLDVKTGSGAFLKTLEESEKLAKLMVRIGTACNRNMAAVITNMDSPLGKTIGNSLEVVEAIEILNGNGDKNLTELCITLATEMLSLSKGINIENSKKEVIEALYSGTAIQKLKEMVEAQEGNKRYIEDPSLFEKATVIKDVYSIKSGYISRIDAEKIGKVALILGAGRDKKDDDINLAAGIVLNKKIGDFVNIGESLAELHTSNIEIINQVKKEFLSAFEFSQILPEKKPLIYKIIR